MSKTNLKDKFLRTSFEHTSLKYFKEEIQKQEKLTNDRLKKAFIGVKLRIECDKDRKDEEKKLIESGEVFGDKEKIRRDEKYLEKQIELLKNDKEKLEEFILKNTDIEKEELNKEYKNYISNTDCL